MKTDEAALLRPGEEICDLQRNGLRILQPRTGFRFGTDAVLLADFCQARAGERVADMGTGTGVLAMLIAGRAAVSRIDAFELDEQTADMALRSVHLNALEDRVFIHHADVREAAQRIGYEQVRLVVSNPPYLAAEEGLTSPDGQRALARGGAGACPIGEWVRACGQLLQYGGRLCMVYPAPRLLALCDAMRSCGIEPKRLRFVAPRPDKPPKLLLLEGRKGGGAGLHVLPALFTHEADGRYSAEMLRIYGEDGPAAVVDDPAAERE